MIFDHTTAVILTAIFAAIAIGGLWVGFCVNFDERHVFHGDITGIRHGDIVTDGTSVYRVRKIHAPDTIICTKEERP